MNAVLGSGTYTKSRAKRATGEGVSGAGPPRKNHHKTLPYEAEGDLEVPPEKKPQRKANGGDERTKPTESYIIVI
jgi:hypothetical protein